MSHLTKVERFLTSLYENRICEQYDAVIPVVGDEGVGKSTFIAELSFLYDDVRGLERDPDRVLDSLVFTREELQERFASAPARSVIAVPDAARVLHKKEAMKGEQVEVEKDFFDVRSSEYLVLLGFQDWGSIPSFLQERRAKFAFYLPRRGVVRGYSRSSLDRKVKKGRAKWPPSDLTDSFPGLDGTEFWKRYQEKDQEKKNERMGVGNDEEETGAERLISIAEEIKEEGVEPFISVHGGNGTRYLNTDLIELSYDLPTTQARKVKSWLEADDEVVIEQDDEDEEDEEETSAEEAAA